jgi:hypothetical protein
MKIRSVAQTRHAQAVAPESRASCAADSPHFGAAPQKSCVIMSLSTRASDPSVKPWPMPNSTLFGSPL